MLRKEQTQKQENQLKSHSNGFILERANVSKTPSISGLSHQLSFRHYKAWAPGLDERKRVAYVNHGTFWRENHDIKIGFVKR